MTMTLSGNGTITGLVAGGLPDATITQPKLAAGVAGKGPAFSAYANAATSLSNGAYTKVLFQATDFDTTGGMFASSRFTPTIAGYYQINAGVGLAASYGPSGQSLISIFKNGIKHKDGADYNGVAYIRAVVSSLVYFNGSTDYIEIYMYQGSGAAINTSASSSSTWFNGVLVRAA